MKMSGWSAALASPWHRLLWCSELGFWGTPGGLPARENQADAPSLSTPIRKMKVIKTQELVEDWVCPARWRSAKCWPWARAPWAPALTSSLPPASLLLEGSTGHGSSGQCVPHSQSGPFCGNVEPWNKCLGGSLLFLPAGRPPALPCPVRRRELLDLQCGQRRWRVCFQQAFGAH